MIANEKQHKRKLPSGHSDIVFEVKCITIANPRSVLGNPVQAIYGTSWGFSTACIDFPGEFTLMQANSKKGCEQVYFPNHKEASDFESNCSSQ